MLRALLLSLFFIVAGSKSYPQVTQTDRIEIEKKYNDDFSTVVPADEKGLIIIRDINKPFSFKNKFEGDAWEISAVDTSMAEVWKHELEIDYDYLFKGYELSDDRLYLLFRDGEYVKNNYYLLTIDLSSGDKNEYEIENEIAAELSHITVVDDVLILGGYVRNSPTLVSYQLGKEKLVVIPGFFKDRSDILDLRSNENGTFNVLTLEKAYQGSLIRLRTHSRDGTILFEREVDISDDHRILSSKSTGFVNGNFAITGSYGGRSSYYSQGVFFAIVKPEGQKNKLNFIDFTEMNHFFDYMRPKRADRIKRRIERKRQKGKDYKYLSRILINEVFSSKDGFIISAEVYDPKFRRVNQPQFNNYSLNPSQNFQSIGNQYVRQPNRLVNVNDAEEFEFLESILLSINNEGDLLWDQSLTIEDVEKASLEQVVDVTIEPKIKMLYKNEDKINYKIIIDADSTLSGSESLRLKYDGDEVKYSFEQSGGAFYWYGNYFVVWGDHKIENKSNPAIDSRRNVFFINKVRFDEFD